jgi:hypothetical protein
MNRIRAALFLALALAAPAAGAADLLTIADVQSVSGLALVESVAKKSQPGAGGDLNFVTGGRKLVLTVGIHNESIFPTWKRMFARDVVVGIGDEAFTGPREGAQPYVFYFRKGGKAVSLSSHFDKSGKPLLTVAKLTRLAGIAASRL